MSSPALGNEPQHTAAPASRTAPGRPPKTALGARIALVVLLVAELMDILDQSIVLTALPAIQSSTGADPAAVQWLTAGYSLMVAVGLITGGRLGDLHGRRRILLLGTVVFTVASLLCGVAAGPGVLIGARVLQGAGVALMIPQVLATLHVTFDGENRSKAFGLYGAVLSLASVLGPVLGGLLTEADLLGLSWRPIFLINVPVGLAVIVLGRRFIPESTAHKAGRLDLTGMLLSALAIVLILFPLTEGHAHHWPLWCFAMLAAGVLVLGVFLRHQRARQDSAPLVTLSLFRSKQFSGGLCAQLALGLLCGLFFMTWTLYLQRGLGMSPFHAAVAFVLLALGELAGATIAAKSAGRFGRRLPQAGALIALGSMAAYGFQIGVRQADLTLLAMTAPVVLIGFGLGMVGGPLADMSLAEVPHENAGSASGLFNTAMHLGIALGTALTALVFFAATNGSADGGLNRDAFTTVLWWVGGTLTLMWALMFCLPTRASGRAG
ncbi:MFS transporter [Streptomyces candidus]|uniref:EmrB/QacA subfamily drug resistance transporter n=1 Tax=Streptomyces candidus TaxID=67283 RepID=A0A7X0HLK3_9ACTN|nr:MFS transporter [Streptomyces candidus]MBB6438604.1 EmrB/QacA subfamily drug resistance transporter [Streptomyces candidus]GHH45351.1 MFS transporter [Streptomyces candidus]